MDREGGRQEVSPGTCFLFARSRQHRSSDTLHAMHTPHGGTGSPRSLTRTGIPAAGKVRDLQAEDAQVLCSQSRPALAGASGIRSPGTPPLPARLDRLAMAQSGHLSAFSWSPERRARLSALWVPPTQGKAHPRPPIGRLLRMSSGHWWSLPRSQIAFVGPSSRQVFVRS